MRFSDLISSPNVFSVGLSGIANRSEIDAGRREDMSSLAARSLAPNSSSFFVARCPLLRRAGVDAPVTLKSLHQTKLHHPHQINLHPDLHTSDLVKTD